MLRPKAQGSYEDQLGKADESEDERLDFIKWISLNPLAGDVIPGADGARKVRWSTKNQGKRAALE